VAWIPLSGLIEAVKADEKYSSVWEAGVAANEALHISLGPPAPGAQVDSESYDGVDGTVVVIDFDSEGRVFGVEFT